MADIATVDIAVAPARPEAGAEAARLSGAMQKKHARAGVAMAAATFAMAATSGVQAVLYLHSFGVNGRTDGFFVAFAIYAIFGVFSQSIRVTSAPLLVGSTPRLSVPRFMRSLGLIAVPLLLLTVPLAHPLAQLLAPGLKPDFQDVTASALPILGIAMVLQLWAAGAATVLAVRDRFTEVALAYICGAVAGLATYLAAHGPAGELSLGWAMLGMGVVTLAGMCISLARSRSPEPETTGNTGASAAGLIRDVGTVLARNSIYLAVNGLYAITMAFTSRYKAGDTTVLSYAYLYASYLVAGTGFALGMSRISDMSRTPREIRPLLWSTVPQGFRYAMLLVAPALGLLVAAGAPLIGRLFSASVQSSDVAALRQFGALMLLWTIGALLVNLLLPALFAIGRSRLVNLLAVPLILVHLAASALGGALFGVTGVVGAACVAPLLFGLLLLRISAGEETRGIGGLLAGDALRFVVMAAAGFAIGAGAGAALGGGIPGALAAALIGGCAYAAMLFVGARREIGVLLAALGRGRPAPAGAAADAASPVS